MSGGIYLIREDGKFVPMEEQEYPTEDRLQELLANYSDLLAGDQMSSGEPRRWLLISREQGVPSEEGGGDQWSIDHLFLDQDAIPTIVEVKRGSNTQIRREVVGQMLDYAANAVVYWPADRLRARFEEGYDEPEQQLIGLLEDRDADLESFWQKVKTNLQAGRVRLIFVADKMPAELRRVVEFLNQQMDPAEVLAVEIKQYVGENMKTLVPRVVGQTEEAQQKKSGGTRQTRKWNESSFFESLAENRSAEEVAIVRKIFEWFKNKSIPLRWGTGSTYGSFTPTLERDGLKHQVVGVYNDGTIEIKFAYMQSSPPFDEETKKLELRNRLNEIPEVNISAEQISGRRPWFYPSVLKREDDLDKFLQVLDWFFDEVKAT